MFQTQVVEKVALAPYTTFKIGGPADYFFIAADIKQLQSVIAEAKEQNIPYFILGNGSNILISDNGFRGLVVKNELSGVSFNNNEIVVGAGVTIAELLSMLKDKNLSGLEFLTSIPATIGGAVWANAGSKTENIGLVVKNVKILDAETNEIKILNNADCHFSYRHSIFKEQSYIILEITFALYSGSKMDIEKKMGLYMKKKLATQDLDKPSAGSIFVNPPQGKKAWELIADMDLRGYQIGGAKISDKHCNFIINTGHATASDVIILISLIKQKVRDNLGVQLMEEIKYIGF